MPPHGENHRPFRLSVAGATQSERTTLTEHLQPLFAEVVITQWPNDTRISDSEPQLIAWLGLDQPVHRAVLPVAVMIQSVCEAAAYSWKTNIEGIANNRQRQARDVAWPLKGV